MTRPWHHRFDVAVRGSGLPATVRALLWALNTYTDGTTGLIPYDYQPAMSSLITATGLKRDALISATKTAESAGWLLVVRPTKEQQRRNHARNEYVLLIPPDADPNNDGGRTAGDILGRASRSARLGVVGETDQGLVGQTDTTHHESSQGHGAPQRPPHGGGQTDPASAAISAAVQRAGELWDAEAAALDMIARHESPERIVNTLDARTREQRDMWNRLWSDGS